MYSLLEQHNDGSLWYHPGWTFDTKEQAEEKFKKSFWFDENRPHMIIEHDEPIFQDYSTCTRDGKTFEFAGYTECTIESRFV